MRLIKGIRIFLDSIFWQSFIISGSLVLGSYYVFMFLSLKVFVLYVWGFVFVLCFTLGWVLDHRDYRFGSNYAMFGEVAGKVLGMKKKKINHKMGKQ